MENIISANSRAILSYSLLTCTLLMSINGQAQENVANYQQQEMSSQENNDGLWSSFKNNIAETWNKPQQQDLFIPVLTRHNRHTHSKNKLTDIMNIRGEAVTAFHVMTIKETGTRFMPWRLKIPLIIGNPLPDMDMKRYGSLSAIRNFAWEPDTLLPSLHVTTMITCLSLWCYRWCLPDIRG